MKPMPILYILEALDKAISEHDYGMHNSHVELRDSGKRKPDLMDATKAPTGDLIDLNNFDRAKNVSKVYASVAEMKRSKVI